MINEEKVKLMTKAAIYEQKKGRASLKTTGYFRHDYISLELLKGWFFGSLVFALLAALWCAYHMEYLLNNIHKMDLKQFGLTAVVVYVAAIGIYLCILYGVCSYRYYKAHRSVNGYVHTLNKISDIYRQEEKGADAGVLMEDEEHD